MSSETPAIDFYFDFSSPYGYLAATRIEAIAAKHRRQVNWRPILLGPMFKAAGTAPLIAVPLKGPYSARDLLRTARFLKVPYVQPEAFPIGTQNAARAFYWLADRDQTKAQKFAMTCYTTYFGHGIDISSAEKIANIAAQMGEDRAAVLAAMADPIVKERLKGEVDAALAKGVFGSPFIIIDGEPFWGNDRLDQVDAWLATGGF
ncbi:MAG: 2-hydroxychromene-2-carboxylate isomerase [Burkholderiales bacterium]|nr:2-hydroxychromene-2-carboxylate isomerase [Burkholderiales bacterium]